VVRQEQGAVTQEREKKEQPEEKEKKLEWAMVKTFVGRERKRMSWIPRCNPREALRKSLLWLFQWPFYCPKFELQHPHDLLLQCSKYGSRSRSFSAGHSQHHHFFQ